MSKKNKKDKLRFKNFPLVFFDSETTGVKVGYHELIQIGYVVTDCTGQIVYKQKEIKIKPKYPHRITKRVAELNGYTAEKWQDAVPLEEAMRELVGDTKDCVFIAHNVTFDWNFVDHALRKLKLVWQGDYHKLDTATLVYPLVVGGVLSGVNLKQATELFGYLQETAHDALSDAKDCHKVFLKIVELYTKQLEKHLPKKKKIKKQSIPPSKKTPVRVSNNPLDMSKMVDNNRDLV